MIRNRLRPVTIAATLGLAATASGGALERYERAEIHMGVRVRMVVYAPDARRAADGLSRAFGRVAALDAAMSDYRADSELSRLSARAGQGPQPISDDLFAVLARGQALARRSSGAFDVTIGPVSQLWRRSRRREELPDPARLAAARALTGYGLLSLDPRARTAELARPGMRLDLGGIAKGWAADAALRVLQEAGLERALVAVAGDIALGAPPPDRVGWSVGVATPTGEPGGETLELSNAAVSTSGDAEQFAEIDGSRYSHIVDPRTGLGLTPSRQATVIAPDGATADALATATCVLGPEAGMALVESTPGAASWMQVGRGPGRRVVTSRDWSRAVSASTSQNMEQRSDAHRDQPAP